MNIIFTVHKPPHSKIICKGQILHSFLYTQMNNLYLLYAMALNISKCPLRLFTGGFFLPNISPWGRNITSLHVLRDERQGTQHILLMETSSGHISKWNIVHIKSCFKTNKQLKIKQQWADRGLLTCTFLLLKDPLRDVSTGNTTQQPRDPRQGWWVGIGHGGSLQAIASYSMYAP